jgi:hypothetical protein
MALTTPQDIIGFALRAGGVLGVGQSALPEDYADAFTALNGMLAQWNRKRWLIYHLIDKAKVCTGAQTYSVGVGQDFDVPRVDRLEFAYFRQFINSVPNQVDYPLQILQSREDYSQIQLKMLSSWPTYIFFDSGYPTGTLYPWPIPQAGQFELHIVIKAHLDQFTTYTQTVDLPEEYQEALWTNLAIRLAAIYPGLQLPPVTVGLAKASLETIRMANTQIPRLNMPPGMVRKGLYNIFSGTTY